MSYGPSGGELLFAVFLCAALGYGALRGCEAGCSYVGRRVNVEWRQAK